MPSAHGSRARVGRVTVEIRHLRAFAAVAGLSSFTKASRELLVTQPALTRTIQQLEHRLETRLLERTSRSVALTTAGEVFLEHARRVLSEYDAALASLRDSREIRVGFEWALPSPWSTRLARTFTSTHGPTVTYLRHDDAAEALRSGSVDAALVRRPIDQPALTAVTVRRETRFAAVATASPLAKAEHLHWDELTQHTLIVNTVNGSTWPELWSPENQPRDVITCTNYDEWINLVASDRGVGTVPQSATITNNHPAVTFVALVDAPDIELQLLTDSRRSSALVRHFAELALEVSAV